MFTSSRITRMLALAGLVAAMATTSGVAVAAQRHESAQARSAARDRALAIERYYSSYGDPEPIASPQPADETEWPIIGLIAAGGVLLVVGAGIAVHRIRGRRETAGAAVGR